MSLLGAAGDVVISWPIRRHALDCFASLATTQKLKGVDMNAVLKMGCAEGPQALQAKNNPLSFNLRFLK